MTQLEEPCVGRGTRPRFSHAGRDRTCCVDPRQTFEEVETDRIAGPGFDMSGVERFGFDGYQLAAVANLVAEITVGNQHARKLTARLGADKFASLINLGHCGCSKTLIAKKERSNEMAGVLPIAHDFG